MNVNINQARADHPARAINDALARPPFQALTAAHGNRSHHAVLDPQITNSVYVVRRVNDPAASKDHA
jgi:hypothetical protein